LAKLVVRAYTMSLDGFTSAPNQSLQNPFGEGGITIMDWAHDTRTIHKMFGTEGGSTGIEDPTQGDFSEEPRPRDCRQEA